MGEIIMYEIIEYIGISLWIINLILFTKREISRKNKYIEKYNIKMLINEPFHLFRIDSVFFLIVYIIYNNLADNRFLPYLYVLIMITNIVYVLYDIADNYKGVKNIFKKELINYLGIVLFALVVFIYWFITKNLDNTCILTLVLNLLVPVYIWVVNMIKNESK